ncbi:DUF2877 domain-containing protein [Caballeronia sp. DA-9]|uniref:DUF2877 domain-containing protein n=1 Tax=Caballeronia sp. DA-9 TaxID=3436237 RepID=UPI003F67D747
MALISFEVSSIGYLAEHGPREALRFWVHSHFQHALNLSSANGELLTLLSPRFQNLPTAIRIVTPPGWDWRHQSRPREPVVLEGNVLHAARWRADLSRAPCWRPKAEKAWDTCSLDAFVGVYPALASQLVAYCRQREVRSSLQLLPGWPANGRAPRLNVSDDASALNGSVSELIGFGTGLTPDGDDYLLGYLAALQSWQHIDVIAAHLKLLESTIKSQLHRTTSISRHYLTLALQGHYSEPVDYLISILIRKCPAADIALSANKVMEFGASSGVDCLGGFLHGIRSLETVAQEEIR